METNNKLSDDDKLYIIADLRGWDGLYKDEDTRCWWGIPPKSPTYPGAIVMNREVPRDLTLPDGYKWL